MNYYADRPIENKASDLLGRSSFSEKLSKAIGGIIILKLISP